MLYILLAIVIGLIAVSVVQAFHTRFNTAVRHVYESIFFTVSALTLALVTTFVAVICAVFSVVVLGIATVVALALSFINRGIAQSFIDFFKPLTVPLDELSKFFHEDLPELWAIYREGLSDLWSNKTS